MAKDIIAEVKEKQTYDADGRQYQLPILYRQLDCFMTIYTADWHAARAVIPSLRLNPVKVWPGRTIVGFMAYNYLDTDIGPYGEFGVGMPCTCVHQGKRFYGFFVQRLPVTTEIALDYGVRFWGYPKFVSEMEFKNEPDAHSLKLTQGGNLILNLHVPKGGFGLPWAMPTNTFTIRDNEIIYTKIKVQAMTRATVNGLARLELGDHPMSREIASFRLGARPLLTADLIDARMVLPAGESLGPAGSVAVPVRPG